MLIELLKVGSLLARRAMRKAAPVVLRWRRGWPAEFNAEKGKWRRQRAVCHDLDAPVVLVLNHDVRVTQVDVGAERRSRLAANTGCCSFERDGPGP